MGQIGRHQASGTAGAPPILEVIDHVTHRVFAGLTVSLFRWQQERKNGLTWACLLRIARWIMCRRHSTLLYDSLNSL